MNTLFLSILGICILEAIIIVWLAVRLYKYKQKKQKPEESLPNRYQKHIPDFNIRYLFGRKEQAFFWKLLLLVKSIQTGKYMVFGKVRILDLIRITQEYFERNNIIPNTDRYYKLIGPYSQRHVDYVICNKTDSRPVLCIELNDETHDLPHRQKRDAEIYDAFNKAQLPILFILEKDKDNTDFLLAKLQQYLK